MTSEAVTSEQGVTPENGVTILSEKRRRAHRLPGQPITTPRSDRSAKAGRLWGRREIAYTITASSVVTHEEIKIHVPWEEPAACDKCGCVPVWDDHGDLRCYCKIWAGPNAGQETKKQPDVDTEIQKERRNQAYQRNLRQFFKPGRR